MPIICGVSCGAAIMLCQYNYWPKQAAHWNRPSPYAEAIDLLFIYFQLDILLIFIDMPPHSVSYYYEYWNICAVFILQIPNLQLIIESVHASWVFILNWKLEWMLILLIVHRFVFSEYACNFPSPCSVVSDWIFTFIYTIIAIPISYRCVIWVENQIILLFCYVKFKINNICIPLEYCSHCLWNWKL